MCFAPNGHETRTNNEDGACPDNGEGNFAKYHKARHNGHGHREIFKRGNRGGAAQAVGLAQAVTDKARVDAQEHEKAPIFGGWPDPWAQKKNHRAIGCAFCEAAIARDGPKTQSHNEKGGLNIG